MTADPSITSYQAIFNTQYRLTVSFNSCPDATPCLAPGTVIVNGTPITSNQTLFLAQGSSAQLQAYPNSGYVFAGWQAGSAQTVQGFQTSITMNGPTSVTAVFQPVQFVNLATVPAGLSVLADRTQVFTPIAMQWGLNTVHTLGPVSPQTDNQGANWVFGSWSDGGTATHAYTVPGLATTTVTATYVPGAAVALSTSPAGLNLTVDGVSNWPTFSFVWGEGSTHTLSAPSTQTDAKGNIWAFANWSNGGSQTQSLTVPVGGAKAGVRVTANYTQLGHMTVTSPVSGLSVNVNGSACAVPCDIQQPLGTQLTITAPASVPVSNVSRQDFAGWSNGGGTGALSVTLGTTSLTVAANYHQMNYLATTTAPTGAASWSLQPASPDSFYDSQTSVTLNVTPLPGFRFQSWSGDLSGSSPSATLAMSSPRAVQAVYNKVPYIAPTGVMNGAGTTPQTGVAAGSVVSVFGANLAGATALGPSSPMVQTLGWDDRAARAAACFRYSSFRPGQINFQLPSDLQPGTHSL